jgi:RNA polymerase sigma-70 factor, ECF subfamily
MSTRTLGSTMDDAAVFEDLRPLLFSIAYRMLGSVSDAEDVVQEAFLRYRNAQDGGARIDSPKAYLSAVVTRLGIDELRSARSRRETYVGQWLPEPLPTDERDDDPASQAERSDTLSMAFLLALERLTPVERAVFLLHDVFDYAYDEIAPIVERTPANCRQLGVRARRSIEAGRPRFDPPQERRRELADAFFNALEGGDVDGLVTVLAGDVTVYGDGGGKTPQWTYPIAGRDRVVRLLAGVGRQLPHYGLHLERRELNGAPGALVVDAEGRITNVFVLELDADGVHAVRSVINPDKLGHLGPVADVGALLRGG